MSSGTAFRAGVAVTIAALIVLLYSVDPASGLLPRCPFLMLTDLYCPGCGAQRALHALLHGRVGASLDFNPLLLPGLLFFMVEGGIGLMHRFGYRISGLAGRHQTPWIVLGIILAFWILRNIPAGPLIFLQP